MSNNNLIERNVTVSARAFLAAYQFVSRELTRYYLNGAFIEPLPGGGGVLIVGTDGHTLGVVHDPTGRANRPCICPMPRSIVERAVVDITTPPKIAPDDDDDDDFPDDNELPESRPPPTHIHFIGRGYYLTDAEWEPATPLETMPKGVLLAGHAPEIDGTFPDWRKVVPSIESMTSPASTVAFNVDYLQRFAQVARILGAAKFGNVECYPQPGGPWLVRVYQCADFLGVVMPLREEKKVAPTEFVPAFVRATP